MEIYIAFVAGLVFVVHQIVRGVRNGTLSFSETIFLILGLGLIVWPIFFNFFACIETVIAGVFYPQDLTAGAGLVFGLSMFSMAIGSVMVMIILNRNFRLGRILAGILVLFSWFVLFVVYYSAVFLACFHF